jgi:hypothetical protein
MSIAGLKRSDWNQPIITSLDQLYFAGNETNISCGNTRATKVSEPINIQDFLTDEQLNGNYGPDDYILARPKQKTLQPEGFQGRVAINEYGIRHDMVLSVDNGQFLSKPKFGCYAVTEVGPNLKKLPTIHRDLKDILKKPTKIVKSGGVGHRKKSESAKKILPDRITKMHRKRNIAITGKYKEVQPMTKLDAKHLKDRLDMAISQMDFSVFKRQGKKSLSRKHLRDRIQRSVETIAFYTKDPKRSIDLEHHLKENQDIMTGVLAYIEKEPKVKVRFEKYLKEHKDIIATFVPDFHKTPNNKERDILHILREYNQQVITAPMLPAKKGPAVEKGVSSTCYLDDRFLSYDQLDPVEQMKAIEPRPAEVHLPLNVKCANNISY